MKTKTTDSTGGNRGNRDGNQNLCSLRVLLFKSCFVIGDQEVSKFSDEFMVNCAPLV